MTTNSDRWRQLNAALGSDRMPLIADIGANPLNVPVYKPLMDSGLCAVVGFEPQKEAYQKLLASENPREHYMNFALGDGAKHRLNVYRESGLSSVYDIDPMSTEVLSRNARRAERLFYQEFETIRLDDVPNLPKIDLVKIDVQGAEAMVLSNGVRTLSHAVCVIAEVRFFPLYEEEPALDQLLKVLRENGFLLHRFLHLKSQTIQNSSSGNINRRRNSSQLLDGDAVFLPDIRRLNERPSEDLKSLALIADAVLQSHDLCLHCLDLLLLREEISAQTISEYLQLLPQKSGL